MVCERLICQCFDDFDRGGKGYLSRRDLKYALTALVGFKPSKYEVGQIMERFAVVQVSGELGIVKSAFVELMRRKLANTDKEDIIRQAFCAFDIKCRGFLTFEDALECFQSVFPSVSPKIVLDAFKVADRDGDARVGFAEFVWITDRIKF
mmetsp:Transcript_6981/g.11069  ORF Transcript_6981/g.11069 Transcript_6981/m.11069 type:complete len:150 (+) Transcript_6981:237-686(+)|eukprot:CAMPEP_0203756768 /NCGR_PEP_ID=MMETSP0098-20131031/9967_1 /ASSEMBLY_ACC=CAM_ASM_000208 /TAXON_ID=96639 /ORGANISM=" , Strain NY0313808BC1" /LENGTH=149 /DNA_ID=CAMNT_0050648753 /DNA_START=192 /DNA_END=641 /DNA_ORIENTATION=+